jgi:hypothetical protein
MRINHLLRFSVVSAAFLSLVLGVTLGILPTSALLFLVFGAIGAGFVTFRFNNTFDLLHPVRVFGAMWCVCVALGSLKLDTSISDRNFQIYAYILEALLVFTAGFAGAKLVLRRQIGPRLHVVL